MQQLASTSGAERVWSHRDRTWGPQDRATFGSPRSAGRSPRQAWGKGPLILVNFIPPM